ncbi:hypothetical protein psal_cds_379 [Pandoravirus salinus]|uniref:Uncharacterized protein n=1 Tax=Pandoravirus salinus TaxID=1349410 RepID=S4VX83_9VIRU|nr:hypothetical protein psal_cds_379 [Pandoravirus salinus]AGO84056.1 hypothetical protein psal_cds_379 [Pandoravirus salinus]
MGQKDAPSKGNLADRADAPKHTKKQAKRRQKKKQRTEGAGLRVLAAGYERKNSRKKGAREKARSKGKQQEKRGMEPFLGAQPAPASFRPRTMALPRGAPTARPFATPTAAPAARTLLAMGSQQQQQRLSAPADPLEAARRFLAANGALAAAEISEAPWPDALKPVAKDVEVGPRGGGFYYKTHPDGRKTKVYLKKKQRQDCKDGVLLGAGTTCPAANITGYRERGTTRAEEAAATAIALMGAQRQR